MFLPEILGAETLQVREGFEDWLEQFKLCLSYNDGLEHVFAQTYIFEFETQLRCENIDKVLLS
jgi:hypothetical protein